MHVLLWRVTCQRHHWVAVPKLFPALRAGNSVRVRFLHLPHCIMLFHTVFVVFCQSFHVVLTSCSRRTRLHVAPRFNFFGRAAQHGVMPKEPHLCRARAPEHPPVMQPPALVTNITLPHKPESHGLPKTVCLNVFCHPARNSFISFCFRFPYQSPYKGSPVKPSLRVVLNAYLVHPQTRPPIAPDQKPTQLTVFVLRP